MESIRPAAVAGSFYPGEGPALDAAVRGYLAAVEADGPAPKALIAPHAGYVYSGPVAATVYARLRAAHDRIRRVVLLGPAHYVALRGLAVPSAAYFETPLGRVAIDTKALARVLALPQVTIDDAAHAREHSLEVQLPFLQQVLGDFTLAPLAVGEATANQVGEVIEALWGGEETLVVVSSDLSHYHDYATARRLDAATSKAIERLDIEAIGREQACGRVPILGLLSVARRRNLAAHTLDLRNSGDTAGPRERVVGYGAYALAPARAGAARAAAGGPGPGGGSGGARERAALLAAHGERLLDIARAALDSGLARACAGPVDLARAPDALKRFGASFVTLEERGRLRGCVGSPRAWRALGLDVAENAYRAGFEDPRFAPLEAGELGRLDLSISVLSEPARFAVDSEDDLIARLRPGVDGVILCEKEKAGLFLPAVWDKLPEPAAFVARLKVKAGFAPNHWSPDLEVWRFATASVSRPAGALSGARPEPAPAGG